MTAREPLPLEPKQEANLPANYPGDDAVLARLNELYARLSGPQPSKDGITVAWAILSIAAHKNRRPPSAREEELKAVLRSARDAVYSLNIVDIMQERHLDVVDDIERALAGGKQ
jgi:hypothetical protein